jgi:hypothetical protein
MAEGFGDVLAAWEDLSAAANECREFDDQHVLVLDHRSGRGHGACKGAYRPRL